MGHGMECGTEILYRRSIDGGDKKGRLEIGRERIGGS